MFRHLAKQLRFRLLLLVILAVIPALGLMLYAAADDRAAAAEAAQTEALRLARQATRDQARLVEQARQVLIDLSQQPSFRRVGAFNCGTGYSDLRAQYLQAFPRYVNLGAIDAEGNVVCSVLPVSGPVNVADQPYFADALRTLDFTIGQATVDPATGRAFANFVYPLLDFGGEPRLLLFASLDLEWLDQFVSEAELPEGSTLTVFDQDGRILARHPEPQDWVGQTVPETALVEAARQSQAEGTIQLTDATGTPQLYAYSLLHNGSGANGPAAVYVSVGLPTQGVYAQADRVLARNMAALGLFGVLALLVTWVGGDLFVLRPMQSLLRATQRVAAGELQARTGLAGGPQNGEIGLLASAFDQMAETLERREGERRQAEINLQASEIRNRALVNAIPDLLLRMNRNGDYLDYHAPNPAAVFFPPESLIGMNIRDTGMDPDLINTILQTIAAALDTNVPQTLEFRLPLPEDQRYYEARCVASGQDEVVVIVRNISERKVAERALARWANVFEHAEWGVAVGAADGRTLELVNPAFARMHGYAAEEMIGLPINQIFAPGAEVELRKLIDSANDTGHGVKESAHRRKDGSVFPVLVDLTAVRDEDGQLLYRVANVQDITARKSVEAELQASEGRFRSLIEISPVGVIIMTPTGNFRYVSPSFLESTGFSEEELLGQPILPLVHADDWSLLADNFGRLVRRDVPHATIEYRQLRKDGDLRIMEATATVLPNGDLVGYVQDVTERKRVEAELREREAQYRSVFEATSDGLFINDLQGHLVDFNPAAAHMHGYTVEEFRALQPAAFIHPDSLHVFGEYMEAINAGRIFSGRATDVRKDGGLMPIEVLGTAFTYRGQPHSLGVVRDVTAQVRALEMLEQRVEERTRELTTLLHLSRHLTSTLQLDSVLGQFLERIRDVIVYEGASIFSLDGDVLHGRAYRGPLPESGFLSLQYSARNPIDRQIIATGRPLILPDLHADTPVARDFRALLSSEFPGEYAHIRSWMRVPLSVKERVIGMLTLHHPDAGFYAPHQAELAMAFADQAAVAMENARLFEATQRRAEQFRVIGEMGYRITSILAVDELLQQTVRLIRGTFGYYHVHIGLIEGERVVFKPEAGLWQEEERCEGCQFIEIPVGEYGMSGRVAASGTPLLIPDIQRDSRFIPLVEGQAGSALVLPLKVKGKVIGVLEMESHQVNAFDASDVAVLQSFANQTAIAIENARLYEGSQQLAALEERQRLARELHDSVSQALYGIALGARTARAQLDRAPDRVAEPLDYVLSLSDAALSEMRALIFELRPESLEAEGLAAALEKQADALRARHQFAVRTRLSSEPRVPLDIKQALYRIAQEALHNVVKHARASHIDLILERTGDCVVLEVIDDGVGFDITQSFPGHLGLQSMRERAEKLGGSYSLSSSPGTGSHLRVEIPLPPPTARLN